MVRDRTNMVRALHQNALCGHRQGPPLIAVSDSTAENSIGMSQPVSWFGYCLKLEATEAAGEREGCAAFRPNPRHWAKIL